MGFLDRLLGGDGEPQDPEQAASLAAIREGGLPLNAQRRLRELAGAPNPLFTSNLTVADFAIGAQLDLQPICSVMGSSIFKVGWLDRPWAQSGVLRNQTNALNRARKLALDRLREEARLAGADAVVEVRLQRGEHDFALGAVEFIAQGTAVRDPAHRREVPVLTDVTVADLHRLRLAGHEPVGLVAASTVYYVYASWATQRAQAGWLSSMRNQELTDFTAGVYTAREIALASLQSEAEHAVADGVVGVDISHHVRRYEANSNRQDLIITFELLGTAIRTAGASTLTVTPTVPQGARR